MGFFSTSSGADIPAFWNQLTSEQDLSEALAVSAVQPVVLFKHSTRCIISKTVLRNFEAEINSASALPFKFYFLDLLAHREVSQKIAEELAVTHQSPQVILVEKGAAVYHASHDGISLEDIQNHS